MKQPAHDVSDMAFRSFVRASGLFRSRMKPYFARFGVSPAQWGVLRALHLAEVEGFEGLRLTELGRRLLVKPPSVTGIVDRLEGLGLVSRHAIAADQRVRQLKLTPAGRRLVTKALAHRPAQIREVLGGLTLPEQRELHTLTKRLAEHLESLGQTDAESLEGWSLQRDEGIKQ